MERTCIVTRRQAPPEAMIRFVRAPDGALTPDIRSKLPGRGVWVTARADLVAEAARKQIFARSLKAKVQASPDVAQDVDRLLETDCLQMLALANKAGLVIAGFGKVGDALEKGAVTALVEASEGGEDGKRKLAQIVHRAAVARAAGATGGAPRSAGAPQVVSLFSSLQLDLALGRTNVIHAALTAGGPTVGFLARCARLAAYRGMTPGGEAAEGGEADDGRPDAAARQNMNLQPLGHEDPGSGTG